jgi:hypothetical protein
MVTAAPYRVSPGTTGDAIKVKGLVLAMLTGENGLNPTNKGIQADHRNAPSGALLLVTRLYLS